MLSARYFDGRSAEAHGVDLRVVGELLEIRGEGIRRDVPVGAIDWPERTRHGRRVAHFQEGGSVQCDDAAAWDAWMRAAGWNDGWVVRAQQSWRAVVAGVAALVLLAVALQVWGVPALARGVAANAPWSLDESLGRAAMSFVDGRLMRPSKLASVDQQRIRAALQEAVKASGQAYPPWELVFRDSTIGPNALALPGGTLIMTDQMVELLEGDVDVATAVLAHELGHVRHRHGLRAVVQVGLLGALAGLVLGDFSTLLAGVPVALGQASYSRDAEREADAEAVRLLRAAGISPAVMLRLFERLAAWRAQREDAAEVGALGRIGLAFASHPPDAERVQFFANAALQR